MGWIQSNTTSPRRGYVYVLEHNNEQFKIGKAAVWATRVKQLKIQLPFKVSLAYAFATEDYHRDEAFLHKHFASKRLNGEWFTLDLDDFGFIAEYCNYSGFYELRDGSITPDPFAYENAREAEIDAKWEQYHAELWKQDDWELLGSECDAAINITCNRYRNEQDLQESQKIERGMRPFFPEEWLEVCI